MAASGRYPDGVAHDPQTPKPEWYEHDMPTTPTAGVVALYTVRLVRTLVQTASLTVPLAEGLTDAEVLEAVAQMPLALPESDWTAPQVAVVVPAQCLQRRPRR